MEKAKRRSSVVAALAALLCALALLVAPHAAWAADGATELGSEGGELESGSYVLNEDVVLASDITIPSGAEVVIDLNGHTLTGTGTGPVITVYGTLSIEDGTASGPSSVAAGELPSSVYSDGDFTAATVENGDGTWTTYYSVTDYDDDGELAVFYYAYTSGALTGGSSTAGGGVYVAAGASLSLSGGTITHNSANSDDATNDPYSGGGVFVDGTGSFSMSGGAISGNDADEGAGVDVDGSDEAAETVFSMSGGVISGNTAVVDGGGAHIDLSTFTMTGGCIADNTAQDSYGGGVSVIASGVVTLDGGTITNNVADGENSSAHYGGGLNLNRSSLTMKSGLISGNYTSSVGGGVRLYNTSSFTMEGGSIIGNTAANMGGGVALSSSDDSMASSFTMSGGTIADNVTTLDNGYGMGGGVYVERGTFTMTGGVIKDNEAGMSGGGLYIFRATGTLSGGSITGNTAAYYGGGIYAYTEASITGGTVSGNSAMYGGGVYAYYNVTLSDLSIADNTATYWGGGVYASYGVTMSGCSVTGNVASDASSSRGGGIYLGDSTLTMTGSSLSGNSAARGGGLYVAGGTLSTSDVSSSAGTSVVANNTATTSADDLYVSSSASIDLSGIDNSSTTYLADGEGALIEGWYEDASTARYYKNGTYNISEVSSLSSGTEYSLVAAHDFYTVTYYDGYSTDDDGVLLNEGWGALLAQSDDNIYGDSVPTTDTPARAGYTFLGWELVEGTASQSAQLSALSTSGSSLYSSSDIAALVVTGDLAFVAQWEEEATYTVTYTDGVEGEEVFADQTTSGLASGVATPAFEAADGSDTPSRAGYVFAGWSPKVSDTVSGDAVYVAQWEPVSYTVTYHANAEGATGSVDSQTASYAESVTVSANGFSLSGYVFTGWNTEADGTGTSYAPSDALVVTSDVDLYAQWRVHTYTVTYTDGVEGEEVFADQVTTGLCSGDATPSFSGTPTREGYTFAGWSPEVAETVTGDAVYVAQWEEITYTVTYTDGVDGEEVFVDQVTSGLDYGAATPVYEGTPTRSGYTFAGWSPEVSDVVTGDAVYVAQWVESDETEDENDGTRETPSYYTVTYTDGVDGEEVFVDQVTSGLPYGVDTPVFEKTPTRAGYVFVGWSPEVADTVTEDAIYVAQWEPVSYTVTYHANAEGATGSVDSQTASYEEFVSVSYNGFSLSGCTFTGWNTEPDGSGTAYLPGDDLAVTSDIDLYAQWETASYTVTYHANADDATGTTAGQTASYLESVTVSESGFERSSYVFVGWNISPEGDGTSYAPGDALVVTSNIDLYAQWEELVYTVTYTDGVDGEEVFADQVTSGLASGVATPAFEAADGSDTPTRTGYTFVGWSPEVADTVSGDVTYVAQWEEVAEESDEPEESDEEETESEDGSDESASDAGGSTGTTTAGGSSGTSGDKPTASSLDDGSTSSTVLADTGDNTIYVIAGVVVVCVVALVVVIVARRNSKN